MLLNSNEPSFLTSETKVTGTLTSGKILPQNINSELGHGFSQSLIQANEIYSPATSVQDSYIINTEGLTEVEASKALASAMPLLIQSLEKLQAESTQLGDTYNKLTRNGGVITKAEILKLADLAEEISSTRTEIEQIMSPLDNSDPQTKQLLTILLPVFDKIDTELEILTEFNKTVEEQLASIESANGNLKLDFAIKLSQDNFDLIDQDKRLVPFSFVADDLTIINHFLNKNFNGDNGISHNQAIENTDKFISSFEKYQDDRKEAYLAHKKLKASQSV